MSNILRIRTLTDRFLEGELHDIERFLMRHLSRFQESFNQCFTTSQELIFISCDLLWHMDILYELTIVGVHGNLMRIVDVVDDEVSFCARDDTDIVAYTGGARLQVAQHTVL